MSFAGKVIITAAAAFAAHLGIIIFFAGGALPPLSSEFLFELSLRYTIAAIFAHSVSWNFPIFINATIVGGLLALNMAFIILTFQGPSFFGRAISTNGVGGLGLAIGAVIAAMIFRQNGRQTS